MAFPIAAWLIGSAIAQVAGSMFGAKKQAESTKRAAQVQERGASEAMAFEREVEAQRQKEWRETEDKRYAEYQRTENERKAAWEAQEAREAPKRALADSARAYVARRLGIEMPPMQAAPTSMPSTWGLPQGVTANASTGAYAWAPPTPQPKTPTKNVKADPRVINENPNVSRPMTPDGGWARVQERFVPGQDLPVGALDRARQQMTQQAPMTEMQTMRPMSEALRYRRMREA